MDSDRESNMSIENRKISESDSDSDVPLSKYKKDDKLTEEELAECCFMPKEKLMKALKYLSTCTPETNYRCKHNILALQRSKIANQSKLRGQNWKQTYLNAINKAIYSHDWNTLCYILKKSLLWDTNNSLISEKIYTRALTILLMYHPSAKSQSLLSYYMHMGLSLRSDQDKKAMYKVLLSMSNKLLRYRGVSVNGDEPKMIEYSIENLRPE